MQLKKLHLQHPNATHVVYAFRLKTPQGFVYRFNDAGEPSGTAGKPIFQHLEGKQLIDVLIVVIRYFGGIKLGAGGLTRAYSNTAKKVIDEAVIEPFVEMTTVKLSANYNQMLILGYLLKKLGGRIIDQQFSAQINLLIELPAEHISALQRDFPLLERI